MFVLFICEKTAWQLVNRKADFFYKTNRFESIRVTNRTESIRVANWNALGGGENDGPNTGRENAVSQTETHVCERLAQGCS